MHKIILDTSVFVNPACSRVFGATPTAALIEFLERARHTTNCAFGGPDGKRLFITEGDNILAIDLPVAGRTLFSHQ